MSYNRHTHTHTHAQVSVCTYLKSSAVWLRVCRTDVDDARYAKRGQRMCKSYHLLYAERAHAHTHTHAHAHKLVRTHTADRNFIRFYECRGMQLRDGI